MKFVASVLLLFSSLFLVSCETTKSGYGYIAEGLDEASIEEMIVMSDEAVNERNFEVYKDLYSPDYYRVDKSDTFRMGEEPLRRIEYLTMAKDIFRYAKELIVYTEITDIEFTEPGVMALVTVREDGRVDYNGSRRRMVSIVELEVGFEDGWIFVEKATIVAKQEIKE